MMAFEVRTGLELGLGKKIKFAKSLFLNKKKYLPLRISMITE